MITHIFFDLDRTIWDFEFNSNEALQDLVVHFRLPDLGVKDTEIFLKRYRNQNDRLWFQYRDGKIEKEDLRWLRFYYSLEQYGISDKRLSIEMSEFYLSHSPKKSKLIEGIEPVIAELAQSYPLYILSNGFTDTQELKLISSGIRQHFKAVYDSEQLGARKPSIEIFQKANILSGSQAQHTLIIGDDYIADVKGAIKAGWKAIWFNTTASKQKNSLKVPEIRTSAEILPLLRSFSQLAGH